MAGFQVSIYGRFWVSTEAEKTFDGMRKHLARDFDLVYLLELGGNVRKHPDLSGTTHNVFGIQIGVSINLFVRLPGPNRDSRQARIFYHGVPLDWRREQKYEFLVRKGSIAAVNWRRLDADGKHNWLTSKANDEFANFLPLGSAKTKGGDGRELTVFRTYSLGVSTNRDAVVYDFDEEQLERRVKKFAEEYNAELFRWRRWIKGLKEAAPRGPDLIRQIDDFVNYDKLKWSRNLKRSFRQGIEMEYKPRASRESSYRPFTMKHLHLQRMFVDEAGTIEDFLPNIRAERDNVLLLVPAAGGRSPFWCFATKMIPNLNFVSIDSCQCFPLYAYTADHRDRVENIPTPVVSHFRAHYLDQHVTQRDMLNYVYGILHHPEYRARYTENLKQDLPRIPLVGDVSVFRSFADAGKTLLDLHVHYEKQPEYELQRIENPHLKLDWRVETMKLSKDRTALRYNDFLTLTGIPREVFEYRLGNRSALEWVIDQYRVIRDDNGEIISDANQANEEYIVRLVGKVIRVSLETLRICRGLPALDLPVGAPETSYEYTPPPVRKVAEPNQN